MSKDIIRDKLVGIAIAKAKLAQTGRSAIEVARDSANLGFVYETEDYLSLATDIPNSEKTELLASAYDNAATKSDQLAGALTEQFGRDQGLLAKAEELREEAKKLRASINP